MARGRWLRPNRCAMTTNLLRLRVWTSRTDTPLLDLMSQAAPTETYDVGGLKHILDDAAKPCASMRANRRKPLFELVEG